MTVELTPEPAEVLIESLRYSKQRLAEAHGTPYSVRQENLGRLEAVEHALREMKKEYKLQA